VSNSFEAITSISGQRNGSAITGLEPGGNPSWYYDQAFEGAPPQFSNSGLLFDTADGHVVNLYSVGSQMYDSSLPGSYSGWNPGVAVQFSAVAVPEPETYAMMLSGLGLMGFIARRRRERDVA
jgi:hypothetical protein